MIKRNLPILLLVFCIVVIGGVVYGAKRASARNTERWYQRMSTAEEEGRKAGADGIPAEACPYPPSRSDRDQMVHGAWKRGWMDGFRQRNQSR